MSTVYAASGTLKSAPMTWAELFAKHPRVAENIKARRAAKRVYSFWNYVVWFANDRVKVGVTGDPRKRVSYYLQEAARHDLSYLWFTAIGGLSKPEALFIERTIIRTLDAPRIAGHREWFMGGIDASCAAERLQSDLNLRTQLAQPHDSFRPDAEFYTRNWAHETHKGVTTWFVDIDADD